MKKKYKNDDQLSLFESNDVSPKPTPKPLTEKSSIVDFARARFEQNPDMDQEEYRRWIRFLVNASIKRID